MKETILEIHTFLTFFPTFHNEEAASAIVYMWPLVFTDIDYCKNKCKILFSHDEFLSKLGP